MPETGKILDLGCKAIVRQEGRASGLLSSDWLFLLTKNDFILL
ncbi:hypothetical protein [Candidatus Erwinia haradaeae]|nr:hypothetical protein [Candidatus Erwinia haradaeae]